MLTSPTLLPRLRPSTTSSGLHLGINWPAEIKGVPVAGLAAYGTQKILCEVDKYVRRSLNETGLHQFYFMWCPS